MKRLLTNLLTVLVIAGNVFSAPLGYTGIPASMERKRPSDYPRELARFLQEETERREKFEAPSALRPDSDKRSRLEDFAELYIRQYVDRERSVGQRNLEAEALFGSEYRPAEDERELLNRLRFADLSREDELERLLEAEEELVTERISWERSKDAEYGRSLGKKRTEYERILEERDLRYETMDDLVSGGDELWASGYENLTSRWSEKQLLREQWDSVHRAPFVASVEDALNLSGESEAMLVQAETELYRGGNTDYWRGVKGEFRDYLDESGAAYRELITEELEKIHTPAELALAEAEARVERADARMRRAEGLLLRANGETVPLEGFDDFAMLRASLVDFGERGSLFEGLEEEYEAAARAYGEARDELEHLRGEFTEPEALPAVTEEVRNAFRREDEARAVYESFRRGQALLSAKKEKTKRAFEENREDYRSRIYDLLLVYAGERNPGDYREDPGSTGGNGAGAPAVDGLTLLKQRRNTERYADDDGYFLTSAEIWLNELEKERKAGRLSSLLKKFALAYGHETDDLDPGYASDNSTYKALKRKVGNKGEKMLRREQTRAYKRVSSNKRKKVLYSFYRDYMQIRPEASGGSVLRRAAVEDLGKELFSGITYYADEKVRGLKKLEKEYNRMAIVYLAKAATLAACLQFGLAATFAGIAATAKVTADRKGSEAGDISSLRKSLNRSNMSGRNERRSFIRSLAGYSSAMKGEEDLQNELVHMRTEKRSLSQWAEEWKSGSGAFDFTGEFFLEERKLWKGVSPGSGHGAAETPAGEESAGYTAAEFLKIAESRTASRLVEASGRRRKTWEERYAVADWVEKTAMLRHALLESEAGRETTYADELFRLRARREKDLMDRRMESAFSRFSARRGIWRENSNKVTVAERSYWKNRINGYEEGVEDWDREFRGAYDRNEELWKARLSRFRNTGVRIRQNALNLRAGQNINEVLISLGIDRNFIGGDFRNGSLNDPYSGKRVFGAKGIASLARTSLQAAGPVYSEDFSRLAHSPDGRTLLTADPESGLAAGETGFASYNTAVRDAYGAYLEDLPELYRKMRKSRERAELTIMVRGLRDAMRRETKELNHSIRRANESVDRNVDVSLRSAGYREESGKYRRTVTVDVSLYNHEMEEQRIRNYSHYSEPKLMWENRLDRLIASNRSYDDAEHEYQRTLKEIAGREALVFGENNGDIASVFDMVSKKTEMRFTSAKKEYKNSGSTGVEKEGLFYYHVGSAPNEDGDPGYGELGRIFSEFRDQEQDYQRVLATMELPSWDRKLWDDDKDNDGESDGIVSAPTTRQVVNTGVSVAASIFLSPGVGQLLVSMGDDALFSAADVQEGRMSVDEAAFSLGKSAAVSGVSMASSSLWDVSQAAPVGGESVNLINSVVGTTGDAVTRVGVNAGFSGLGYSSEDGFEYDTEKFTESLLSGSSIVTVSNGLVGTIGRNAYHNAFMQDEMSYGFSTVDMQEMQKTVDFGFDLASAAAVYGIDGELDLNVLGTDDFLKGLGTNTGLIRLDLSKEGRGAVFSLGTGGYDVSGSRIGEAFRGAGTLAMQQRISALTGELSSGDTVDDVLRFQHSFGDGTAQSTLRRILSGEDSLSLSKEAGYYGLTRVGHNGGRDISLNGLTANMKDQHRAKLQALFLQHEAYRDGRSGFGDNGPAWSAELEQAVAAHSRMASAIASDTRYSADFLAQNPQILLDMAVLGSQGNGSASALAPVYDNSSDYWKLSEDGYLDWDGSHHLWGPDGRLLASHERGSFSQDVADYLGMSRDEALEIMDRAGLTWSSAEGTYIQGDASYRIPAGAELMERYRLMDKYGAVPGSRIPVSGRTAYAWELREAAYAGDGRSDIYDSYASFAAAAGLSGVSSFNGIQDTATLQHYSQQRMETAVTGAPLDASAGNGYCLADSLAFAYVDTFPSVDWADVQKALSSAEWNSHFDPSTGYVGDKTAFTRILADELGVSSAAVERRFSSVEALNSSLAEITANSSNPPAYRVVANYGNHFTHVRPDGTEINSYPGWSSDGEKPEEWRLVTWETIE